MGYLSILKSIAFGKIKLSSLGFSYSFAGQCQLLFSQAGRYGLLILLRVLRFSNLDLG